MEGRVSRILQNATTSFVELITVNDDIDVDQKPAVRLDSFDPLVVKGILLEYYGGVDLYLVVNRFPRSSWKGIMDGAMETVKLMGSADILNWDIRAKTFLVFLPPQEEENDIQVLMIDFGCCALRIPAESEAEWGSRK